jgi:hypothetical protein
LTQRPRVLWHLFHAFFFPRRVSRFFRGEKLTREYYIFKGSRREQRESTANADDTLKKARKRSKSSERTSGSPLYPRHDFVL